MIRGFYTARTGLMGYQEQLNVISNNIANVNTTGFKPMNVSFADLMYQNLNRTTQEGTAIVGHGVKINKTDLVMGQGAPTQTSYALDFAILEDGAFFAIENDQGEIHYTRAGNFIMSNDGSDSYYLAAANGDRVLDEDGSEIELEFDEEGNLEFDFATIGVYRFQNPYGLQNIGNNRFIETPESGAPEVMESPNVKAGYLEASGTDMATETVRMIESSKAFSFNSRMIQVADEVEQIINSLR